MTWSELGSEMGKNAVLYALVFGILMALLTGTLRKCGLLRRGKSLLSSGLVVLGVAGTIASGLLADLITIDVFVWLLAMFTASGVPMLIESAMSDYQHIFAEAMNG